GDAGGTTGRRLRDRREAAAGSVEVGGDVDRAARRLELLGDGGGEHRILQHVEHGRGEAVGAVGRGEAGLVGDRAGRELAGVQRDVRGGDPDHGMDAGQAIAGVGGGGGGSEGGCWSQETVTPTPVISAAPRATSSTRRERSLRVSGRWERTYRSSFA